MHSYGSYNHRSTVATPPLFSTSRTSVHERARARPSITPPSTGAVPAPTDAPLRPGPRVPSSDSVLRPEGVLRWRRILAAVAFPLLALARPGDGQSQATRRPARIADSVLALMTLDEKLGQLTL